jgi:nitric oxide reductase large subunit
MRYAEINIFGVYVAPFAPMMLAAWLIAYPLQRMRDRFGVTRHVWHPPLFNIAVYIMILSLIVIGTGWRQQ